MVRLVLLGTFVLGTLGTDTCDASGTCADEVSMLQQRLSSRTQGEQRVQSNDWCAMGIFTESNGVCCAATCGSCGGPGCGGRPGGQSQCCHGHISGANRQCESGLDVSCMAPTGCLGTYQAEDAEIHGSQTFQNNGNHNGAQGDAFVDFLHGSDAHVEWSVESCHGGAYSASFRYALSGGNRPLQVLVNGESQVASLSFPGTGSWSDWGMATVIVNLGVGSNTIRLAAISSSGANVDSLTLAPACLGTYQAEDAQIHGAQTFQNNGNHNGAQGDAFVDYLHGSDAHVEWSIPSCSAGLHVASFRYALSGGNRPLQVLVNGESQVASLSFPATGSWSDWGEATVFVNLEAGDNSVRLAAIDSSGANVDSLTISPAYQYGEIGENTCPFSDVTEDDCLASVQALLAEGQTQGRAQLVAGSWNHVPPGCSVQSHFTYGREGDWAAHYNRRSSGQNDGGYTPLCLKGGVFTPAATDTKCPHHPNQEGDRLFRTPESGTSDVTLAECYSECASTTGCNHFSHGPYQGGYVCMGCTTLENAQTHSGFTAYNMGH